MPVISLIIPCYNEEKSIPLFYDEIIKVSKQLSKYTFEYIFVDDGSFDKTLSVLKSLNEKDEKVKYLSFSRNFGKEAAMYAGLKTSSGSYVAVIDVDLQDPPNMLIEMVQILEQGEYDAVAARRVSRKGEPPIRSFFARAFYNIFNKMSKTNIVDGARDYRLMTRQMVNSILELEEVNRFSKGIFGWVGYSTKWLTYQNIERVKGETKWSFFKLLIYSIEGIVAFSTVPLAIASFIGIIFFMLSIVAAIFIIIREFIWQGSAYGWASMVAIIFGVSGIQLFCIGIIGQYLSKTYLEVKKRPLYIVKAKSDQ